MLKAIIFDMDGVLVDSEPIIYEAARRMFAENGVTVSKEDFKPFVGAGENRYLGGVAQKYGLELNIEEVKARTYEIYAEIVKENLEPLPGVHDFYIKSTCQGIKTCACKQCRQS